MLEVADIFRLHGPALSRAVRRRACCPHTAGPCRTSKPAAPTALGGQLYFCNQCQQQRYSYHSCKNRHCPKCQNEQANDWLAAQQSLLLPVHSLPRHLYLARRVAPARAQQSEDDLQPALSHFAAALLQLAQDPRFVGARLGMVGVLHTWTRQLLYHPHVHYIVTGGGLTDDGRWRSARKDFLVPVKALSPIFRAKFRDALKKTELFAQVRAPRLAAKTGWSTPNRWAVAPGFPVSRPLHLPRRPQQQPPAATGTGQRHFLLQRLGH